MGISYTPIFLSESVVYKNYKKAQARENPRQFRIRYDRIRGDIRKRVAKLSDNLSVRQESIKLLKGRLKDQITSFE